MITVNTFFSVFETRKVFFCIGLLWCFDGNARFVPHPGGRSGYTSVVTGLHDII